MSFIDALAGQFLATRVEHETAAETQTYIVENILPALVVALQQLLMEVKQRRHLEREIDSGKVDSGKESNANGSESTAKGEVPGGDRLPFNATHWLAQFLYRHNPRHLHRQYGGHDGGGGERDGGSIGERDGGSTGKSTGESRNAGESIGRNANESIGKSIGRNAGEKHDTSTGERLDSQDGGGDALRAAARQSAEAYVRRLAVVSQQLRARITETARLRQVD